MVENLDKLIERDGKIEVILQKAESLSTYSKTYRANVSVNYPNLTILSGQKSKDPNEEQKNILRMHANPNPSCKF